MSGWRPSSGAAAAGRRAAMLGRARAHFHAEGVLAVDTPALSPYAGSDPEIDSLAVSPSQRHGGRRYLQTSPEFAMKRLLAAGYPDIYSICRVFRDGESGRRHVSEFTMLEWYRLGFGLEDMVGDTLGVLARCLDDPSLAASATRLDYRGAMQAHADLDPFTASVDELAAAVSADRRLRRALGDDRDAWLDLVLTTVVAPAFAAGGFTVLCHYPASQAALARSCPADARVADRFEVFWGDLEVANGYVELTDPREQRERIERDLECRRKHRRPLYPWDRKLLAALESGLPDCAGVAVGVERLQMVLDGTNDIRDVLTFADGDSHE